MRPVSWSSSYLLRDPLGISTTTWMGSSPSGTDISVPDEAEELVALDPLPAFEELELDQGGDADDLAPQALDQAGRGPGGAAGGEHVVDDQDPLAGDDLVGEQRGDVLEDDPRLGEVGHVTDEGPQALGVGGHGRGPPVDG